MTIVKEAVIIIIGTTQSSSLRELKIRTLVGFVSSLPSFVKLGLTGSSYFFITSLFSTYSSAGSPIIFAVLDTYSNIGYIVEC